MNKEISMEDVIAYMKDHPMFRTMVASGRIRRGSSIASEPDLARFRREGEMLDEEELEGGGEGAEGGMRGMVVSMTQAASQALQSVVHQVGEDMQTKTETEKFILGTATGWFGAMVVVKFSKKFAATLAGSVVMVELLEQFGYAKVNWHQLKRDMRGVRHISRDIITGSRLTDLVAKNAALGLGVMGGAVLSSLYYYP